MEKLILNMDNSGCDFPHKGNRKCNLDIGFKHLYDHDEPVNSGGAHCNYCGNIVSITVRDGKLYAERVNNDEG